MGKEVVRQSSKEQQSNISYLKMVKILTPFTVFVGACYIYGIDKLPTLIGLIAVCLTVIAGIGAFLLALLPLYLIFDYLPTVRQHAHKAPEDPAHRNLPKVRHTHKGESVSCITPPEDTALRNQLLSQIVEGLRQQLQSQIVEGLRQQLQSQIVDSLRQRGSVKQEVRAQETEENRRWPLFTEKELGTMGWLIVYDDYWKEINNLLAKGFYNLAEKKAKAYVEEHPTDMTAYLLLLEAQHRKGDFEACSKTYEDCNDNTFGYSGVQKTPIVLEYCEAMIDLQPTATIWIQLAHKGAYDCIHDVMSFCPPERAYIVCIRACKRALARRINLLGFDEESMEDYIHDGLRRYPDSVILQELKTDEPI